MSHPDQLALLLLAEDPEGAGNDPAVAAHVETCTTCATAVAALRGEGAAIGAALREAMEADAAAIEVPPFRRPASLRGFALANIAVGLALWLPQFLWKTLFGELVVNGTSWVTATWFPDAWDLASRTLLALLNEGTAMIETYFVLVATALAAAAALYAVLFAARGRASRAGQRNGHLGLLLAGGLCAGMLATPDMATALEVRRDEASVVVGADETVEDTLIVTAQRVVVAGKVTGDLIALGEDVAVEGEVGGNLVSFARVVRVTGTVGGSLLGAAERLDLDGAAINGDLWVAGERIEVRGDGRVGGNSALAAQSALLEVPVARSVYAAGERLELAAAIGGDLEAAGRSLTLGDAADIAGAARLRMAESNFVREDGALVAGGVEFLAPPRELDRRPGWLRPATWLWALVGLLGSVLVGLALLWLFPGLRQLSVPGGLDGVKTAGIGLVAIVSLPVLAGLAAITLVGLPFGIFGIVAWVALLYVAKVVVGIVVGRMVLAGRTQADNTFLMVLVGMLLVTLVVSIPLLGGIIGAVLTAVGAGLIVERLLAWQAARPA